MPFTDHIEQIKESYHAQGGPDLHENRAKDTGMSTRDTMIGLGVFFFVVIVALMR